MSKENEETLKVYDVHAKTYLKQTVQHKKNDPEKAKKKALWLENFCKEGFSNLHVSAKIMEIGAADGENSIMLEKLGFKVTPSDVADDFLKAMQKKKLKPLKFNLLANEFPGKFDGIFCWRVFVHFTKEDFWRAMTKIFDALNFGGRAIFNVMNADSKDNENKGWYDFAGEYHMGAERFFQHFQEKELRENFEKIGFEIIKLEKTGGEKNDKWFCFVLEKSVPINPKLQEYVETEILTQYDPNAGHGVPHINYVIRRSFNFAQNVPEANFDMVYTIAAYHDIGRKVDNAHHEIESAKILLKDTRMKEFFSDEELKIIAEAIEDHRASLKREPRSIYGKIVSSADRNTSVEQMLGRLYRYTKSLMPKASEKEVIESARVHLREKYSPDGYAATKIFFEDPDYNDCLKKVEEITRDYQGFEKIISDFIE